MAKRRQKSLIIIGGHEDREGDKVILREIARRLGSGKIVVTTVASGEPDGLFDIYERAFRSLGVKHVFKLDIRDRLSATEERSVRILDDATGVFFTGGDQLRITSQIGDTPVFARIREIYEEGGVIAGTSAGASVMSETMLVTGNSSDSHRIGSALLMAPGLGLIEDVIIDQHFAERGRIGRLLGAIAQNPRTLGIGIDEDTAMIVERHRLQVLGSGAVYIVDGRSVTHSNIADEDRDRTMSIFDVRLHVLANGDEFDLKDRRPAQFPAEDALRVFEEESKIEPGS